MSKLMDIKGFWDMDGGIDNFIDENMWEGKIILENDGWFEGIANDLSSEYTGDRFIFGVYHPGKVIELLKVSPARVSNPFVFRAKRDAKTYIGEFSAITTFGEHPCGTTLITTQDVQLMKDKGFSQVAERDVVAERRELAQRIETFKMGDNYPDLYSNTLGIRKNLADFLLRQYNGEEFTQEQVEEMLKPTCDEVEKATQEAVKEMIFQMKHKCFDLDDDIEDFS